MSAHKPIVAHIRDAFFNRSETFVYHLAVNLRGFHSVYCADSFINLDQFPIAGSDQYNVKGRAYSLKWLRGKILKKCFGVDNALERTLIRAGAEVIHAHFGATGVGALKAKRSLNIPLVTSFYGIDACETALSEEWLSLYKTLFQVGDLFLAEGPFLRSKLIGLGCPEGKARIQRIGIPLEKIAFRPRTPKKPGEKVIFIFTGRFTEKKGLIHALTAIKEARKQNNNFEFRILGDGPLKPEILQYIEAHQMEPYVKILGFLTYREYIEETRRADIFIHPSVTARDGDSEGGAPTTILEAQAAGMPVIATRHADIPYVVAPGESALLSDERDHEALTRNIIYLLDHQGQWEKMGRAGRAFIEKYHDIHKTVESLEELYRSVLGSA
jgi:colanic acid/amylovoran biosynthesis glycosyltransferase